MEPLHREQAEHIQAKLAEQLETLKLLERHLKDRSDQESYEQVRASTVSVAIGYLQKAMDALDMASRE